jgi:hypothetical protein
VHSAVVFSGFPAARWKAGFEAGAKRRREQAKAEQSEH